MATRIVTPEGRTIWGAFKAKPKPRLKDLQNGFQVKVLFKDNTGPHLEDCTVIEVGKDFAVVEYKVKCWPEPGMRVGKTYPAVPGQNYALAPVLKRIKPGQILAFSDQWSWHAKVYSGTPGGTWTITGLLDPAVLDQLTMV